MDHPREEEWLASPKNVAALAEIVRQIKAQLRKGNNGRFELDLPIQDGSAQDFIVQPGKRVRIQDLVGG